ncbi:MAG TPA: bifunctional oligoribonuclease/PAP phosphatase NrnA [Bacillales bacterium]|nr:bifunctional oligoribonuclease/PAP phosphatase NrnA [Bacillales bacterium]
MKQAIIDKIEQYDTIIIHRHVRPDPDALGSQGALAEIIKASYPGKNVFCVGEEEASLQFLNRMDEVPDDQFHGALAIVCDTANAPRISDERYEQADFIIKIDHHPNEDRYGDLLWVDTEASSVCEMIYELYHECKASLVLPDRAAMLLYAGIVGDTGRFLFDSTTDRTFAIAAALRKRSFSINRLYTRLYEVKLNVVRLRGYVTSSFQLSENGAGTVKIRRTVLEQYDATPSDASLLVNAFSDVAGIKAWVFFIEEPDQIRVRLRSKGPVVNEIAKKYGGGGHPMAAGATIHRWEEADQVVAELEAACAAYE